MGEKKCVFLSHLLLLLEIKEIRLAQKTRVYVIHCNMELNSLYETAIETRTNNNLMTLVQCREER